MTLIFSDIFLGIFWLLLKISGKHDLQSIIRQSLSSSKIELFKKIKSNSSNFSNFEFKQIKFTLINPNSFISLKINIHDCLGYISKIDDEKKNSILDHSGPFDTLNSIALQIRKK